MKHMTYEEMIQDTADLHHDKFVKTEKGIGTYAESANIDFDDLMDVEKELLAAEKMNKNIDTLVSDWSINNNDDELNHILYLINCSLRTKDDLDKKKKIQQEIGRIVEESVLNHFKKEIEDDINREIDFINSKFNPYLTHSEQMEFETGVRAVGEI